MGRARNTVIAALVVGLAVAGGLVWRSTVAPPRPPRVVALITLDALRPDHLSLFGYERPTSPNIDRLAAEGLAFRDIVPAGCSTKTSLTSLLTALDYPHHRIFERREELAEAHLTLAEIFRQSGFDTAAFVATGMLARSMHYDRGFDHYDDFPDVRGYTPAPVVGERVRAYLRSRSASRPLFLYVHIEEPHPPWRSESPWLTEPEPAEQFWKCWELPSPQQLAGVSEQKKRNLIAKYDGAILAADAEIGLFADTLRDLDLLDRAVIAVSADHGLELLDRYSASHGFNPFDEVVRGFLVLFDGRGGLPRLDTTEVQGRNFDIGPTLMALAGVPVPPTLDGVDLLGRDAPPEIAFSKCYAGLVARSLDYKLVRFSFERPPPSMRNGEQLFDLRFDPRETVDVKAERPEVYARMQAALEAYEREASRAPTPVAEASDEALDPGIRERLRALGYIP